MPFLGHSVLGLAEVFVRGFSRRRLPLDPARSSSVALALHAKGSFCPGDVLAILLAA